MSFATTQTPTDLEAAPSMLCMHCDGPITPVRRGPKIRRFCSLACKRAYESAAYAIGSQTLDLLAARRRTSSDISVN